VVVGSAASARGLDIARKLIVDGVSPESVTGFREKQGLDAFLAGDAVFLRSWPGIFSALAQAGLTLDQYGVAPLPAASNGGESASCLGGWNLMVNASSSRSERSAAWTFIRYLTAAEQQQRQAREAGMLPVLTALYNDAKLARDVPMVGLSKTVFTSQLRARPSSPVYSELSAIIARVFTETLKGKLTGKEAADVLQKELSAIVVRNR
jgi:ABC-type glycerol-3-phosphate transport system substrate-binding protein